MLNAEETEFSSFLEEKTSSERSMRRTDRELSRTDAFRVIRMSAHAVLSTVDASGIPYGVPVTPVLEGETHLYFHSTRAVSRRSDNMLDNPAVSLCFVTDAQVVEEEFSVDYASAIVAGRAAMVIDEAERRHAMELLCARHAPHVAPETIAARIEEGLKSVSVWRIDIEHVSGKSRGWARISPMLAERGIR